MRTLSSLLVLSCLGFLSACTLFVEVKDPPANNGNNATCGDGVKNGSEQCDEEDLGGATCADLGLNPDGVLACNANCTFDTSGCGGSVCGNGILEEGEACDDEALGGQTCNTLGYTGGGELACNGECQFDVSGCVGGFCGNGFIDADEACDGENLNGQDCAGLGYPMGGDLTCAEDCSFNTSQCEGAETETICNDGADNDDDAMWDCADPDCAGEPYCGTSEFDCGDDIDNDGDGMIDCEDAECSAWPDCMIGGEDCTDGMDNDGDGKADCMDNDCVGHPNCPGGTCGDGILDTPEESCDGANLNGQDCFSMGYGGGGTLGCGTDCNFDFSLCSVTGTCGNGTINLNDGEDCEGGDLQGYSCSDFGFGPGSTLGCDGTTCHFDFSACNYTNTMPARDLVASGAAHTCAASSSSVRCWGYNQHLQLGVVTPYQYHPAPTLAIKYTTYDLFASAIAAGSLHTCALATNSSIAGRIVCWGDNGYGQLGNGTMGSPSAPVLAGNLNNVTALAAGGEHTCALKTDGTMWCWGNNWNGQVGVGSSNNSIPAPSQVNIILDHITDISTGFSHTCAVRTPSPGNGVLYCWGANHAGQLGINSTNPENKPIQVPALTDVSRVACGMDHTCAIAGGLVYCWGSNSHGQLGIAGSTNSLVPTPVGTYAAFKIMAGEHNTCIVQNTSGPVYCWGDNQYGQLAQGNTNDYTGPIVLSLTNVNALSLGGGHMCGILLDGTSNKVSCWGGNWYGQLGNGDNLDQYSPTEVLGQN